MFHRSLLLRAIFAVFATSALIAGCEPSNIELYCDTKCACLQCSEPELDHCNDDTDGLFSDAVRTNCTAKFDAYLRCVRNDAVCTDDGKYDETMCATAEMDVRTCINTVPTCASKNDGVCDEPVPAGNGKCPAGTDTADCMAPTCATTNDGVCDEPAPAGNGQCPAGTDRVDCAAPLCATTNDGVCDEPAPAGNGKCPAGTDMVDCAAPTCATTNDKVCDEPQGSGKCAAGTDKDDCTCALNNNNVCDEPEGTGLCPEGSDSAECKCATAMDGVCDEPQGTGKCALGSDTADCSMPCVTCAEYTTTMMGMLCADSQPIYDSFQMCACVMGCKTECGASYCMGAAPSATCAMCLQGGVCKNEYATCVNDL